MTPLLGALNLRSNLASGDFKALTTYFFIMACRKQAEEGLFYPVYRAAISVKFRGHSHDTT